MENITELIRQVNVGQSGARDRLFATAYDELRTLARSRLRDGGRDVCLDTTALVHESYLRIQHAGTARFADRKHFLGYAAKAMRSIVIDIVRARQADRRGGMALHVTLDTGVGESVAVPQDEVLRVHEALDELADVDERLAKVVEMRYFAGLSEAEIADCLGLTERTVQRDWQKARLFLSMALR